LILFGFLPQSSKTKAVAVMPSVGHLEGPGDTPAGWGDLSWFRREFYASLTARTDALFELTEAVLCADGPVTSLVELTLVAEHRRGHGAMYDALNAGRVEPERLRRALTCHRCPPWVGGSCSRWMSARGCARTPRPARSGCSATFTAERGTTRS
jgi:DDE superfamily endonuclease